MQKMRISFNYYKQCSIFKSLIFENSVITFNRFIQVAGISNRSEADLLIESGINFLGFPLRLTINTEDLTEAEASSILKTLRPPTYGVVITYLNKSDEIINFLEAMNSQIVQLHGEISNEELKQLKISSPDITIIKSLIVGKFSLDELITQIDKESEFVDAFITDTFNPKSGATGATGITHDWEISKTIVNYSSKPIILAGGLNPENVYDAIMTVNPAGVDSHTGVENPDGTKSKDKVMQFYQNAMKAFEEKGDNRWQDGEL